MDAFVVLIAVAAAAFGFLVSVVALDNLLAGVRGDCSEAERNFTGKFYSNILLGSGLVDLAMLNAYFTKVMPQLCSSAFIRLVIFHLCTC